MCTVASLLLPQDRRADARDGGESAARDGGPSAARHGGASASRHAGEPADDLKRGPRDTENGHRGWAIEGLEDTWCAPRPGGGGGEAPPCFN